uniref:Uncharacterized protein n=1 Tax=Globodera rostochiensis TaxID=31243 RepID=A0A914HCA1_GLORO
MEAALRGAYNDARKSVHEIAHSYMLWNEPHAGRFLRITIKPSNTYERRNSCSSAASATGTTGTVICTTGQKHPNNWFASAQIGKRVPLLRKDVSDFSPQESSNSERDGATLVYQEDAHREGVPNNDGICS